MEKSSKRARKDEIDDIATCLISLGTEESNSGLISEDRSDHSPDKYEGATLNGKFHGTGRCSMDKGIVEGTFFDGKAHGQVKFSHSDGSLYEGLVFAGKGHGRGVRSTKVFIYSGELFAGTYHGHGELKHPTCAISYVGQFFDGRYHGSGILKCKNTVFDGEFFANRFVSGKKSTTCGLDLDAFVAPGSLPRKNIDLREFYQEISGSMQVHARTCAICDKAMTIPSSK